MAKKQHGDFIAESLVLRFLTAPLKWFKIILLVTAIVFGSSIIMQNWFHRPDLLEQELSATSQLGQQTVWQQLHPADPKKPETENRLSENALNLTVTRYVYTALSTVFYEWIPINYLLATSPGDIGYNIKEQFLESNRYYLERFDQTLRIISLRLGNAAFIGLFALYLCIPVVTDGLVQRRIRQENASRESAGIYHRAKYWRTGIVSCSLLGYLACPWPMSPLWLFIPVGAVSTMVYLQAKYLKKYL